VQHGRSAGFIFSACVSAGLFRFGDRGGVMGGDGREPRYRKGFLMYDPMTVAFDMRHVVVIWHRDPKGGDLCYGPYHERLHQGHRGINPRWHFWHWEFQVPIIQEIKRWMWSKCARCGDGFEWCEIPCTHRWEGKPARWFRGEEEVYHYKCLHKVDQMRLVNKPGANSCFKGR
jgi:hypothetical protein